jgi:uncharacterized NAD(P)/FAD-binding protein YdhS
MARRIAIVGLGPKGFGCLERLAIEVARTAGPPRLEVTVYDPAPHPGAGPVYDPDQPGAMLLNFAARHVDVWSADHDLLPASQRLDLVRWLERHHPAWADADVFVPRRLVGEYLRDAYAALVAALPPALQLTHVPAEVIDVTPDPAGWRLHVTGPPAPAAAAGAAGPAAARGPADRSPAADPVVDEVMIAAGHGTWAEDLGADAWAAALPPAGRTRVVRRALPVTRHLGPDVVPAGATVAMRGFALTWIDATLALTAVRGGRFERLDDPHPGYVASGDDVARILPYSRSGLPLHAKPGPALTRRTAALEPLWDQVAGRIRGATTTTVAGLCVELAAGAAEALRQLRPERTATAEVEVASTMAALQTDGPTTSPPPGRALAVATTRALCRSVGVAQGRRPPDARFALAEAWRQVYPAMVERVGHGGLDAAEMPAFRDLARGMERLAFGPPAENLARMVALVEAGVLDLRFVRAPTVIVRDGGLALVPPSHQNRPTGRLGPVALDVLVNAIVPPPGVHEDTPLLWRLRARGLVRAGAGGRGVEVDHTGACVGADGTVTGGLAAVGRATEGWVLGNDTLSRRLHPETSAWARRVVTGALARSGADDEPLVPVVLPGAAR